MQRASTAGGGLTSNQCVSCLIKLILISNKSAPGAFYPLSQKSWETQFQTVPDLQLTSTSPQIHLKSPRLPSLWVIRSITGQWWWWSGRGSMEQHVANAACCLLQSCTEAVQRSNPPFVPVAPSSLPSPPLTCTITLGKSCRQVAHTPALSLANL